MLGFSYHVGNLSLAFLKKIVTFSRLFLLEVTFVNNFGFIPFKPFSLL